MTHAPPAPDGSAPRERRSVLTGLFVAIPLLAFAGVAVLCYQRLGADTSAIPSPLIGKEPPAFALPIVDPSAPPDKAAAARFTNADLKTGGVTIVNFFASYCEPCKREQGQLMQMAQDKGLAAQGVRVAGIAWKDKTPATRRFLDIDGNPFAVVGADVSGRTGLDWGITGVPETYIVRGDGTIAYKFVGEMNDEIVAAKILPQVEKAGAKR